MDNSKRWFGGIERLEARTLLSIGAIDTSFSSDGTHTYPFEGEQFVYSASSFDTARDGKIIAAGTTRRRDSWTQILLTRLNPDGTLDRSFGKDGQAITSLSGPRTGNQTIALVKKVLVQGDGKILVAGALGGQWAVFRFTSDGSLDRSFDHDGIQTFAHHSGDLAADLELLPSGKILVGGWAEPEAYPSTHNRDLGLMRLKSNGSIDRSFGTDGYVLNDVGYNDQVQQIAVDGAGNILAAGVSTLSRRYGDASIVLWRYRPDGSLDKSFGKKGRTITMSGPRPSLSSMQMASDGKILLGGSINDDGFLMRFAAGGRIDSSFAGDGAVSFDLGSTDDQANVLGANRSKLWCWARRGGIIPIRPKTADSF